jgi:hypothetical protein
MSGQPGNWDRNERCRHCGTRQGEDAHLHNLYCVIPWRQGRPSLGDLRIVNGTARGHGRYLCRKCRFAWSSAHWTALEKHGPCVG